MQFKESTLNFLKISFGNIIEWYDFALYGIFALHLSRDFFPAHSSTALILTLLTFSVSFIARPGGAFIFGLIGDKLGKHFSVNISVWVMAISTLLVGFLPSYRQLGVSAPILLLMLRVVQGISVGGQFSGLLAIAAESANNKSYYASLVMSISVFGYLLATLVSLLSLKIFNSASPLVWRVPFILSGILFLSYLKLKPLVESHTKKQPLKVCDIFKQQPTEMLYLTLLAAVKGSIYYVLFSYMSIFMQNHLKITPEITSITMCLFLLISLLSYPLFGKIADKTSDRLKVSKKYTLGFIFCVFMLSFSQSLAWLIPCLLLIIVLYSAISSYITSLFAEIFEIHYRMTACSICYNLGAVVSGFSPITSELLNKNLATGFYMFLLVLGFIFYIVQDRIRETAGYQNCSS